MVFMHRFIPMLIRTSEKNPVRDADISIANVIGHTEHSGALCLPPDALKTVENAWAYRADNYV